MAAKKKYKWSGEKEARHSRPERGAPKAKTNKPKPKSTGGGFEAGLKRRTTKASRDRYIQKAAGRRTTDASRQQFLKSHKLRDPDLDDPGYFTRPQTLGQANIEADRAANLRYGEEERGISNERDLVYRQGREIPAWFDQYRQNISQAQGAAAAMAQPVINQAQQTAQAVGQSALAPSSGTSGAATAAPEVAQRDQLAAASRQALAQSFASLLQTNQQATNNYFAGRQGVAGSAQIGAMGDNALAKRQIEAKRTGIAAEKGDYRAGKLAETRDKERQYGLERSAFGLDVQKAEQEAEQKKSDAASKRAESRRKRATERRKYRQDKAQFGQTRADKLRSEREKNRLARERLELDKKKAAKGGGSGGQTHAQRVAARDKSSKAIERITTARGLWGSYAKRKNAEGKNPTPSQIKEMLYKEGYSPTEVHLMLVHRGGNRWGAKERKAARRLGIRIRDL